MCKGKIIIIIIIHCLRPLLSHKWKPNAANNNLTKIIRIKYLEKKKKKEKTRRQRPKLLAKIMMQKEIKKGNEKNNKELKKRVRHLFYTEFSG